MTKCTVYCAQAYVRSGRGLVKGRLRQFGAAQDALEAGAALSRRNPGVLVFEVSGEPDFGTWEEPVKLASYGSLPPELAP